jgi:hypothetical protein
MKSFRSTMRFLLISCVLLTATTAVHAAATRTWVSGTGNDSNPCSYTAPCATFAGAFGKTAINGEINCLDAGEYGNFGISHSITIECRASQGAILTNTGGVGISINITASMADDPLATVRLRGISITGAGGSCGTGCGGSRSGWFGIMIQSTSRQPKVFLEDLTIQNFVVDGIYFGGPGELSATNCRVVDNGAVGIHVLSNVAGSNGVVHVTINKTQADLNQQGIRFEGNVFGVIKDSTASSNSLNGFVTFPTSIANAEMTIRDSTANNNRQWGVFSGGANGFLGTVRIVNTTAIHNTTSQLVVSSGGTICTNQKNHIGTPSDVPSACFIDQ